MSPDSHSFWKFSIRVYDREEVAKICLNLQDSRDFDVNLLLFCLWYGARSGAIASDLLERCLDISRIWQRRYVQPLRRLRRLMKQRYGQTSVAAQPHYEELRQAVKTCELEAEYRQQKILESQVTLSGAADSTSAKVLLANLQALALAMNMAVDAELHQAFVTLSEIVATELAD